MSFEYEAMTPNSVTGLVQICMDATRRSSYIIERATGAYSRGVLQGELQTLAYYTFEAESEPVPSIAYSCVLLKDYIREHLAAVQLYDRLIRSLKDLSFSKENLESTYEVLTAMKHCLRYPMRWDRFLDFVGDTKHTAAWEFARVLVQQCEVQLLDLDRSKDKAEVLTQCMKGDGVNWQKVCDQGLYDEWEEGGWGGEWGDMSYVETLAETSA